jgi:hypothetical protein
MKKILLILVLMALQCAAYPQDEPIAKSTEPDYSEIQTLFKKPAKPVKLGYYIGPEAAWTRFDDRNVFLGGLSMGVIVNSFFSVGLSGYGVLNSWNLWYPGINPVDSTGAYLYGGYGGVKFEFRIMANAPIHVSFPILIGGGGLVYNTWTYHDYDDYNYNGETIDQDGFFVVEPGAMLELNLTKFMRFSTGISYRYTPDLDLKNTPDNLINNFNLNCSLKFGKF